MKIRFGQTDNKIHAVVVCFSIFVALMLFQTSYMKLGTITAAGAIFLTIISFFYRGNTFNSKLYFPVSAQCLVLFLLYSVMRTWLTGYTPGYFLPYIAQIVLCLILFSVSLSERENHYLKNVFCVATLVYAILIIKSLNENQLEGYTHSKIYIFNTEFDPNFVGIPLTAAMALLLDRILKGKHKLLVVAMYMVIAYAVVYTASRGSFVAALVSNGLVVVLFLLRANIAAWKKLVYLLLFVGVILLLIGIVKVVLPVEWARLTGISASDDNGRFGLWNQAIQAWWDKPFLGNGLGYAYKDSGKATHNTYLQILSETGLFGAILFLGFLVPNIKKAFKADTALFCVLMGTLVQVAFLDALSDRCLWVVMCWIAMIRQYPKKGFVSEKEMG